MRAKCVKTNCPFNIFASKKIAAGGLIVKTFMLEHNCPMSFKNRRVTTKWVAFNYLFKYKSIGTMRLVDLN